MKQLYLLLIFLSMNSCLKEDSVSTAQANTFVRYFNGGNNDYAETFKETSDKGFIILITTEIAPTDPTASSTFKIKLIKTDEQGSVQWQKFFPDFTQTGSYKGHSLHILADGTYAIAGEDVQYNTFGVVTYSKALLMTVGTDGSKNNSYSLDPLVPGESRIGEAVSVNQAGNFLLLSTEGSAGMILTEMRSTDLLPYPFVSPEEPQVYSSGPTTLSSHLFVDDNDFVFWGGTAVQSGVSGLRLVKAVQKEIATEFDHFTSHFGYIERATDVSPFGQEYAAIGSTNRKVDGSGNESAGDRDILFIRLTNGGVLNSYQSFPLGENDTQDDSGDAISSTIDGGLILLGSVSSKAVDGRGENDYMLIKITPFGDEEWRSSFGSKFPDAGRGVLQSSDGNFVVLGNTIQGSLSMVMLAKTDKLGKIQ